MVTGLNLDTLSVDESGRASFSGLSSGIDLSGTVDAIVAAKRIPIDRLEARVTANQDKLTALAELRTTTLGLQNAIATLRGAVSVGGTSNVFKAKQTFATVSRADGGTPSTAGNLIGLSVTNAASVGSHTVEVKRIATAHKIASSSFTNATTALSLAGDFSVGAKTITVAATDTLNDIRDRINNANTGTNATGVSASIVTVSSTSSYLILTKDATGAAMSVTDSGTVLSDLGLSADNGVTYSNQLQAAQTAQLYADGILDSTNLLYESAVVTSTSAQLGSSGTLRFDDGTTLDLAYLTTDTIQDLADAINADATLQGKNIAASIVQEGAGYRLKITGTGSAFTVTESGAGSVLTDLGIDNARLLLTRESNTVSDLFAGITLSLFQAEVGTTVKIDVEKDLNSVKTAISGFIDAYNALRVFVNTQSQTEDTTGAKGTNSGPLFDNQMMRDLSRKMADIVGLGTQGVSSDFSVLAQIGITIAKSSEIVDPLEANTLIVNETTLDEKLLSNSDDIRRLFSFDFSSSDPNVVYLSSTGQTTYSATGYTLNIGTIGQLDQDSANVNLSTALLNDATDGFGATISGQFDLNGTAITYDVTVDTLDSLAGKINDAAISGVTASVITSGGLAHLNVTSTTTPLTYTGDTGDLVAALTMAGDPDVIDSADIDSVASSVTATGRSLAVTDQTGALGLKVLYNGAASVTGIQIDFTIGVGAQIFNILDGILDESEGAIQGEIAAIEGQDLFAAERIDEMEVRLEVFRTSLVARFVAMESALAVINQISDTINQITSAWFQNK